MSYEPTDCELGACDHESCHEHEPESDPRGEFVEMGDQTPEAPPPTEADPTTARAIAADGTVFDPRTGEVLDEVAPKGPPRRFEIQDLDGLRRVAGYLAATSTRLASEERHLKDVVAELQRRLAAAKLQLSSHPLQRKAAFYQDAIRRYLEEHPKEAFSGLGRARSFVVTTPEGCVRVGVRKSGGHLVLSHAPGAEDALRKWAQEVASKVPKDFGQILKPPEVVAEVAKRYAEECLGGLVPPGMERPEAHDEGFAKAEES